MLIIHGVKREKSRLGLVAELCLSCRDIRPATVTKITQFQHVYFIPVGEKKVVGYEVACAGCRRIVIVEQVPYTTYCQQDPGDIGMLVEMTNPDAVDRLEARVDLEDRLSRGEATREDRLAVITEAITAAGLPFQAKLYAILPTTAVSIVSAAVFTCIWFILMTVPHADPIAVHSTGVVALACILVSINSAATGKKRLIRRRILPALREYLAPLNPTPDELAEALNALGKNKLSLAKHLKPEDLLPHR